MNKPIVWMWSVVYQRHISSLTYDVLRYLADRQAIEEEQT